RCHQTAAAGADDDDIGIYVLHRNLGQIANCFKRSNSSSRSKGQLRGTVPDVPSVPTVPGVQSLRGVCPEQRRRTQIVPVVPDVSLQVGTTRTILKFARECRLTRHGMLTMRQSESCR